MLQRLTRSRESITLGTRDSRECCARTLNCLGMNGSWMATTSFFVASNSLMGSPGDGVIYRALAAFWRIGGTTVFAATGIIDVQIYLRRQIKFDWAHVSSSNSCCRGLFLKAFQWVGVDIWGSLAKIFLGVCSGTKFFVVVGVVGYPLAALTLLKAYDFGNVECIMWNLVCLFGPLSDT